MEYFDWNCCTTCASGVSQSPVNLEHTCVHETHTLRFDYHPAPLHLVNNGHTVQMNYAPGSRLIHDNTVFELVQFHFHLPGEHHIDGATFAMEMHLVHRSQSGATAVVGVMISQDEADHPAFAPLWAHLPVTENDVFISDMVCVNADDLLPDDHTHHFFYQGSLTTPPCTEGVRWIVMNEPVALSGAQVEAFRRLYEGNNRPLQPLNGRIVSQS